MRLSPLRRSLAALLVTGCAACLSAAPIERVPLDLLFRPGQVEQMALSPDGRRLAYDFHSQGTRILAVADLEDMTTRSFRLGTQEAGQENSDRKDAARITELSWISPDRLVFNLDGDMLAAINADGTDYEVLITQAPVEGNINLQEVREQLQEMTQGEEGLETDPFAAVEQSLELESFLDEFQWQQNSLARRGGKSNWFLRREGIYTGHPQVLDWLEEDPDHILVALTPPGGYAVHDLNHPATLPNQQDRLVRRLAPDQARGSSMGMHDAFPELRQEALTQDRDLLQPPLIFEVYRVNVHTGKEKRIHLPTYNASRWVTDRQGRLRLTLEHRQADRRILYTDPERERWKPLQDRLQAAGLGSPDFSPEEYLEKRVRILGFGYDPNLLYLAAYADRDNLGVYELNLKSSAAQEIVRHPLYDLSDPLAVIDANGLLFDPAERKLVGLRFVDKGLTTLWLEADFAGIQDSLDQALPGHRNVILDWNDSRDIFLVRSESTSDPGRVFIFRANEAKLIEVAQAAPWLQDQPLATTAGFEIPGDNGQFIRGILTLPAAIQNTPIPFVVFPHDGPWQRNRLGFDADAQALASQGFAVIQVNFPGSSGYGYEHLSAVKNRYSQAPLEALGRVHRWFVESGVGDPKKSAVMGYGYGGYLALRSVSRPSPIYRCAVALAAPVSLPAHLNRIENPFLQRFMRGMVGNSAPDLQAGSNSAVLDQIPVPLLLVQGNRGTADAFGMPPLNFKLFSNLSSRETIRVESDEYEDWYSETQIRVLRAVGVFLDDVFNRREPEVEIGPVQVIDWDAEAKQP